MNYALIILLLEAVVLYLLVLSVHSLRHRVGLGPFYALLGGITAIMSWTTDAAVQVEIGSIIFMVGSTVFYTSLLLGVFVVYVFDGPHSTQIAIFSIVGVSILVPIVASLLHTQMALTLPAPIDYIPTPSLRTNAASVLTTMVDLVFLAIAWEFLGKTKLRIRTWIRAFVTLLVVMVLDVLLFNTGAFLGTSKYLNIMGGTLMSRVVLSIIAFPFLYAYINWQNRKKGIEIKDRPLLSIFKRLEGRGEDVEIMEREIELRKLAEDRFRTYLESSPYGIFVTDEEGDFLEVNDAAQEITGYSEKELLNLNLTDLHQEEGRGRVLEALEDLEEEGEAREEIPYIRKDGSERFWSLYGVTLSKVRYLFFVDDITEQRRSKEREDFLHSLLRHDVRNKVQVVQGYLELMDDLDMSEEAEKYLSKAIDGVKEGERIIAKVRSLRKAQKEEKREVKINPIVRKAVEKSKDSAREKGIEIKTDYLEEDCEVLAGTLLNQVFTNLIENAIRHSDGNKIRIRGKTFEDEVVFTVEDNGKGIPDEKKDTVFEKGYTTDDRRGTGLGLFLVKTLLDIYNGSIEIKDSEFGGARFDVHLKKA